MISAGVVMAIVLGLTPPGLVPAKKPAAAPRPAMPAVPALPPTVILTAERASLVLGVDEQTRITVLVTGDGAELATPESVRSTAGAVDRLVAGDSPALFTTVFHVPTERRPQAALIAVEVAFPSGARARGTTVIALPARTQFPFRTDPWTSVTLNVAGQPWGPATADARGADTIPIVVPPGVGTGQAVARARFGGVKEMPVDLQTRDYPRILVFAPVDGETGSTVTVDVLAIEPNGEPAVPEDIDLRASSGTVHRVEGARGLARFGVTLPRDVTNGAVLLSASMSDGASETPARVGLYAGAPAALQIWSSVSQLVVGSPEAAEIEIAAVDRCKNDVPAPELAVSVDDQPVTLEASAAEGAARFRLPPPAKWNGRERATILARLGAITARKEILIRGGAPAVVRLKPAARRMAGDGRSSIELVAELTDRLGTPTAATHVVWSTPDDGVFQIMPPPSYGTYVARFTPSPGLYDRMANIAIVVDDDVAASTRVTVETVPARTLGARVGIVSDLHAVFGQSALIEGTVPVNRGPGVGWVVSVGLNAGYIHSDVTATGPSLPVVQASASMFPLLAVGRVRLPVRLPVDVAISVLGGLAWVLGQVSDQLDGVEISHGTGLGYLAGGGADVALPLRPGELTLGLRYLVASVGRLSNGDSFMGNLGGILFDVGFRVRR